MAESHVAYFKNIKLKVNNMICRKCYFKDFCYASSIDRVECDKEMQQYKDEYYFHKHEIEVLQKRKETAGPIEAERIDLAIDQLLDFMEYCCKDMNSPPRPETDDLAF
jgi:hypothetical protein